MYLLLPFIAIVCLAFSGAFVLYLGLLLITDYEHETILGVKPKILGYFVAICGILLIALCFSIAFITG